MILAISPLSLFLLRYSMDPGIERHLYPPRPSQHRDGPRPQDPTEGPGHQCCRLQDQEVPHPTAHWTDLVQLPLRSFPASWPEDMSAFKVTVEGESSALTLRYT